MPFTLAVMGAFLLGSVPTGYLLTRALKGIDIRGHGSGNPGATNVFRVVGKGAGILTLAIDILKGWAPVFLATRLFPGDRVLASFVALAAIAGHNWTPFLMFRGGKGVATSIGAFLALVPGPAGIAIGCFAACFLITRIVSLSSLAGAAALVVSTALLTRSIFLSSLTAFCALLVFILHKKNISRLLHGEEPKLELRKKNG